jgi:chemotaxis protein methyltransferase CheR
MPEALFSPPLTDREFEKFRRLAYERFGLSLTDAKRDLVAVRLGKRLRELKLPTFKAYYDHVLGDATGESLIALIDSLSTNHTAFMREISHFDYLRQHVLPPLRDRARIDVWSAPCSTGEEPYSILITLLEELGVPPRPQVRIRAVDISTRALAAAQQGSYPHLRLRGLRESSVRKYFQQSAPGIFQVRSELRGMVEFARVNLVEPLTGTRTYPVIFCRNMMIYFDRPTQERVVQQLARCLEPGGHLFIGHSESLLGIRHPFECLQPAVYRLPHQGERK